MSVSTKDILNFTLPTGKTYNQELKENAKLFQSLLKKNIKNSYKTDLKVWKRTNFFKNSVQADTIARVGTSGNNLEIDVYFDDNVYYKSIWGGKRVNVMKLLNFGYKVRKNVPFRNVKYFGWRRGSHFIEKTIKEFNNQNTLGFTIRWSDIVSTKDNYFI